MHAADHYHIYVAGIVEPQWADWFDGLTIEHTANGQSILVGTVVDQAALMGYLTKLYNLGFPLVKVERHPLEPKQ